MSRLPHLRFSDITLVDQVIVAVAPVDAYTGQPVRIQPQDITLCDASGACLFKRAIPNRSGKLVFMRRARIVLDGAVEALETELPAYLIKLNTQKYGYFEPPEQERVFIPPPEPLPPWDSTTVKQRQLLLALQRLPSFPAPDNATLFSGVITTNGQASAGIRISARIPAALLLPGGNASFSTQSDTRGAFTLAVRLPPEAIGSTETLTFQFVDKNGNSREIGIPITTTEGMPTRIIHYEKRHSFTTVVEMTANDEPVLEMNTWPS